ncbi:hypothetical protein [Neotamlana laminarinivorans]|uniref:Uncharacterized protein n=1 Tax=Neotamlana laminarinivorans TaxID=2883124 RepID=A0A9X1L3K3_9FLAO|nr:hypothetical protein [Tamlana laminarinivorans]MCB4797351.1 hypothetical protein [Tamlana laminarinivorans]
MNKTIFLLILLVAFNSNTKAQEKVNPSDDLMSSVGFRPVDPINYVYPIAYYKFSNEYFQKLMSGVSKKELKNYAVKTDTCYSREDRNIYFSDIPNKKIVDLLPNETVEIQISEITKQGGLSLKGAAAISAKNTSYQVTMDYVKFVTINVVDTLNYAKNNIQLENLSIYSYARVGVGLRIVASIETKKSGINLGDLFAIGFAASRNEVSGSLSVNVLGIESREITTLLPMPSEISSASIQSAMQAMATIKSKIYDDDIEIRPQIISIRSVNPLITTDDLVFNTSRVLGLGRTSNILSTTDEIIKYVPQILNCE